MGKSELVFTMTQVEHKAAVKVDESPDGQRVVVRLRVQWAWLPPSRRCIRVRAQPLLCKLGGLRLLPNVRSSWPSSLSCPLLLSGLWSEMQTCIWPSWCHCHSVSLAFVKSRLALPFWYRLIRVVPEKGPLNGCVFFVSHHWNSACRQMLWNIYCLHVTSMLCMYRTTEIGE